jgi:capsular exopolysaccharide synthesis family protein
MSRIYEAIQRADLERNAALGVDTAQFFDDCTPAPIEDPPHEAPSAVPREIAEYPWKPLLESLPTLLERGAGVEQFRALRSHIFQLRAEAPLKTILISSGVPAEGKTFVAANLALSMARNSADNILLIDGDLRRGSLHSLLGAHNTPGLSEYLAGSADLMSVMQRDSTPDGDNTGSVSGLSRITFIPTGACGDSSSDFVSNHRIQEMVKSLSPHFDWIVIDSPPVLAVSDAVELARAADGVLLVARGARTPFEVAQRTQAAFANSRILGFVLNAVKGAPRGGSYSYYYGRETASNSEMQ